MKGFIMMFQKDNIVDLPSAPHRGLWSLADLGTLSIVPGVEDFSLCLTLGHCVGKLSLCSRTYQFSRIEPLTVSMTQPTKHLYRLPEYR